MLVGNPLGHRRRKHRTDIDGHIEQAECRVSSALIARIVVEIADEHLQISLEKARAERHSCQAGIHGPFSRRTGWRRHSKSQITQEHHNHSDYHTLAVADLVGDPAAYKGCEINYCQKDGINLSGLSLVPSELGLHEQGKDGKHGIIAETLASVGQCQRIKALGLSFEHISLE